MKSPAIAWNINSAFTFRAGYVAANEASPTSDGTNVELFYRFPFSSNISFTPDLQFIFNPNNNSGNSTITIGTLRTVFTF